MKHDFRKDRKDTIIIEVHFGNLNASDLKRITNKC